MSEPIEYEPKATKRAEVATPAKRFPRWLGVVIVLVLVAGFLVVLWEEGLEYRMTRKNLTEVEPGLFRSGQVSRFAIGPTLARIEPDLIISLSPDNPENAHNMAEAHAAEVAGIERIHVNLAGNGTGAPAEYVDALEALYRAREADKRVLVHCWAGSERTSGAMALWDVLFNGEAPARTLPDMAAHGHDLDDSDLLPYLNENIGIIAEQLVERGVLDAVPDPLPVFPEPGS
jgi:hypothetical protein